MCMSGEAESAAHLRTSRTSYSNVDEHASDHINIDAAHIGKQFAWQHLTITNTITTFIVSQLSEPRERSCCIIVVASLDSRKTGRLQNSETTKGCCAAAPPPPSHALQEIHCW